jgi:probable biosynthetic protein (TIGR04098 family)
VTAPGIVPGGRASAGLVELSSDAFGSVAGAGAAVSAGAGAHRRVEAPPEVARRIRLGMPHLDAGGLSENWLFRDAGDRHWEAIARRLGVATDEIRSETGERLYPTVVAVRAGYDTPLAAVRENDLFEAIAEVVPCGRACAHGRVVAAVGPQRSRFALELLTTFAARAPAGGGLRMAMPEPRLARRWIPVGGEPPIATLARAARRGEALGDPFSGPAMALTGPPLAELDYEPSPYADYNGAGLLYFASYVTIADSAERRLVRQLRLDGSRRARAPVAARDWALMTSAVRRDVFYYDNLPLGASLTAALIAFDEDCHGVTTRIRLSRADAQPPGQSPARAMADVVTRRLFVSDRGAGRA